MNIYFSILGLAGLANLVGFFWLVITGFKRSVVWGLLVFLLSPLTAIIFALTNWFDARKPFLIYLVSLLLMIGTGAYMFMQVGSENMQKLTERLQSGEISMDEATRLFGKALSQSGNIELFPENTGIENNAATAGVAATQGSMQDTAVATAESPEIQTEIDAAPPAADPTAETTAPAVAEESPAAEPAQAANEEESGQGAAAEEQPDKSAQQTGRPPYPAPGTTVPDPLAVPKLPQEEESVVISLDKVGGYIGRYLILDMKNGSQQRGLLTKADGKSLMLNRKLYGGSMEYRVYTSQIKTVHVLKKGAEPKS